MMLGKKMMEKNSIRINEQMVNRQAFLMLMISLTSGLFFSSGTFESRVLSWISLNEHPTK